MKKNCRTVEKESKSFKHKGTFPRKETELRLGTKWAIILGKVDIFIL